MNNSWNYDPTFDYYLDIDGPYYEVVPVLLANLQIVVEDPGLDVRRDRLAERQLVAVRE